MLSIIPKTDNITNTVSLVDENLLKVIIHINKFLSIMIIVCAKVMENASFIMEMERITVDGNKYFKFTYNLDDTYIIY